MDVLPIPDKYRPTADEATDYRKRSFQNRKPKRDHRDSDGNDRRRLLHALQGQRAEHETHEQAAAVPQENGCGIEVVAEKTDNRARQNQRHDRHKRGLAEERNHEDNQGGEQRRTGSQSVQSIDEVERVGDAENPQDSERKPKKPGKMVAAEQDRKVKNTKPACKQDTPGQHLDQKLDRWSDRMQVIVKPQQKNQQSGKKDREQRLVRKPDIQAGTQPADQPDNPYAEKKCQEDGDPTQTWERLSVQVPFQTGSRYPTASRSPIAYVSSQNRRGEHRGRKNSQVEKRQLPPSDRHRTQISDLVSWMQIYRASRSLNRLSEIQTPAPASTRLASIP